MVNQYPPSTLCLGATRPGSSWPSLCTNVLVLHLVDKRNNVNGRLPQCVFFY